MRVFIIGYMGAGKSTVGKRLARRLELPFIDLDDAFEEKYRYTIPRFFDHFGKNKFRELEQKCLKEIIEENEHAVVSTGGGTACHFDNMNLMNKTGTTVYLQMHPSSLAQRLNNARRLRPIVREVNHQEMLNFIEDQLTERIPFYNQAHVTVKGESLDLIKLVEEILNLES